MQHQSEFIDTLSLSKADLEHILTHTEKLWEQLRGQRIFITGGTGFFGCGLLESFCYANERLNLKAQTLVLTRDPDRFIRRVPHFAQRKEIQLHRGDVCDFAFPEGEFSHIIHAGTAASAQLNQDSPLVMVDTVVQGTRRTLEFARKSKTQRFLLTSSGAVYGQQPAELTHCPEDYPGGPNPLDPKSAYGEGKRLAELLCALYHRHYGIETIIGRCFAFVGPYLPLDIHFAIGNFILDGLKNRPIQIQGDGTPYRSYLYSADLMIWLWTLLFQGAPCRPYNVGSEEGIPIREVAERAAKLFQIEVKVAKTPAPGTLPSRYVPSTRRAESELGLKTWIPLSDAIFRTFEWNRRNPQLNPIVG